MSTQEKFVTSRIIKINPINISAIAANTIMTILPTWFLCLTQDRQLQQAACPLYDMPSFT